MFLEAHLDGRGAALDQDDCDGVRALYGDGQPCPLLGLIFADGFESGDITAWSGTVP